MKVPFDDGLLEEAVAILRDLGGASPVLSAPSLRGTARACFLKAECLQPTGSFKFRSACVRLALMSQAERAKGVITYSSGNFGAGLAAAGSRLGVAVTVVAPEDAPRAKLELIQASGAILELVDTRGGNREEIASAHAHRLATQRKLTKLHPFNDAKLLAGHAAIIAEFLEQLAARDASPNALVVPCGGGGLAAASVWATRNRGIGATLWAVEPAASACLAPALAAKARVRVQTKSTWCDALQAPQVGELAFGALASSGCRTVVLTDDSVRSAMLRLLFEAKLLVEPSAALAVAGILSGELDCSDQTVGVVLTGGNVDGSKLTEAISLQHVGSSAAREVLCTTSV